MRQQRTDEAMIGTCLAPLESELVSVTHPRFVWKLVYNVLWQRELHFWKFNVNFPRVLEAKNLQTCVCLKTLHGTCLEFMRRVGGRKCERCACTWNKILHLENQKHVFLLYSFPVAYVAYVVFLF